MDILQIINDGNKITSKIDIGGTILPDIPFLWYREDQICCPFESATKIDSSRMENIINSLCENNGIKPPLGDCFIVVQRNVIKDASLYISYHSYAYVRDIEKTINIQKKMSDMVNKKINIVPEKDNEDDSIIIENIIVDTKNIDMISDNKNIKIPDSFNKNYIFYSYTLPIQVDDEHSSGVYFVPGQANLREKEYVKGSTFIHDQSFSPPDNFKFKVNDDVDYILMITHGYCEQIETCRCTCLFILFNDY